MKTKTENKTKYQKIKQIKMENKMEKRWKKKWKKDGKKMENATKQRKNGTKDEKKDGKAGKNTIPIKNPKCLSAYYINVATDKFKTYKKINKRLKCLSNAFHHITSM